MAAPPDVIPCSPWTDAASVRSCCTGLDPDFDLEATIGFATAILFRLSGRQFPGECERTIWPCGGCNTGCCAAGWNTNWTFNSYPAYPMPNGLGTGFINVGSCNQACKLERIKLPATVNEINEVWVDGVLLDASAYKIEAYRWLVRVDGGSWPCTNNLSGEIGDPDTWTISYNYGKPVPADGRYAASIFACEIAKEHCGGDSCLPQRLKSIEREGVSMVFPDPLEFLEHGEVGIYEVDLWLKSVNPSRLKRRARLHRPDRPRGNVSYTG